MAVGAGSIKRASKLSTEVTTTKKEVADQVVAEKTVAEQAVKKTETKKAPAKKAPAKKAPAKTTAAKTNSSPKTVKKAEPVVEPKKQARVNQACRLTEELPIYLL